MGMPQGSKFALSSSAAALNPSGFPRGLALVARGGGGGAPLALALGPAFAPTALGGGPLVAALTGVALELAGGGPLGYVDLGGAPLR